jgi:predicted ribosomally synthesized peptide with nif11-like leader
MNIKNFLEAASKDKSIAEKIESCKSVQDFVKVAASCGYHITEEEVTEALRAEKKEMSDADLDAISGGAAGGKLPPEIEFTRRG